MPTREKEVVCPECGSDDLVVTFEETTRKVYEAETAYFQGDEGQVDEFFEPGSMGRQIGGRNASDPAPPGDWECRDCDADFQFPDPKET